MKQSKAVHLLWRNIRVQQRVGLSDNQSKVDARACSLPGIQALPNFDVVCRADDLVGGDV